MLIAGLDVESTGLSIEEDEIIEIGAVLWDTDKHQPLDVFSTLVHPRAKTISPEITALTGIEPATVRSFGQDCNDAFIKLNNFLAPVDILVGHNSRLFDQPMLISNVNRSSIIPKDFLNRFHWIDTSSDVPYPDTIKTRKLVHLAAEHSFLNPFAHRAIFDVLTMLKVLSCYNFEEVLSLSREPSITVQALCSKPWEDEGKSTDEAKANGYRWDGSSKRWLKTLKRSQVEKEQQKAKLYKIVEIIK